MGQQTSGFSERSYVFVSSLQTGSPGLELGWGDGVDETMSPPLLPALR